jgi:glutathione peroxidase
VDLSQYQGKVVLIVNVASECGFTPQYKGLQALHAKYKDEGLAILGFPCNQFGAQEPGTSEEIASFCEENYGVDFDMFEKIDVNGKAAAPLYQYLTSAEAVGADAGPVKWNFEKFLIGRDGKVVKRYRSFTTPEALDDPVKAELAKPAS